MTKDEKDDKLYEVIGKVLGAPIVATLYVTDKIYKACEKVGLDKVLIEAATDENGKPKESLDRDLNTPYFP